MFTVSSVFYSNKMIWCHSRLFFSSGTNWIGLRKLQELDVSDNLLTDLPSSVLHCLKSLNSLNVSKNKLSTFPDPWACALVGRTLSYCIVSFTVY